MNVIKKKMKKLITKLLICTAIFVTIMSCNKDFWMFL